MSEQYTIGRDQSNDIVLSHPYLSEQHAVISLVDKKNKIFHIKDLDTTNGTYKNNKRIKEADFTLKDTIKLAGTVLEPFDFEPLFYNDGTDADDSNMAEINKKIFLKKLSGGKKTPILVATISLVALLVVAIVGAVVSDSMSTSVIIQILAIWLLIMIAISMAQSLIRTRNELNAEARFRDIMFEQWKNKNNLALEKLIKANNEEKNGWQGFRKFEVSRRVDECEGITSFYLSPHDRKPLPEFRPGQYLTFSLDIPGQEKKVIRCYSLSDAYHKEYYRVSIKKAAPPPKAPDAPWGLSSSYFHEQLQVGSILDVKAPSGKFYLNAESEKGVVLIAGGVGITPMVSMLNTLTRAGSKREIWFFYGVRYGDEVAMRKHLKAIDEQFDNVHMNLCFSDPKEHERVGVDFHHHERVSVDLFKRLLPSNNFEYYLCGPPPMMSSVTEALDAWGVPEKDIYFEAFGPASVKKKKKTEASLVTDENNTIEVEFTKSGKKLSWSADNESILEFAEDNGIEMPSGCRAGNCGTCQVAVRSGEVNYTSEHDVDIEDGSCLTCISVPKGNLVLDA